MPRAANVFYKLVTDENSTTELLCNLLRFAAFRTLFLRLFLSEVAATAVAWEDFDTQVEIAGSGRPDLQIRNEELFVLIEIKVTEGRAPTPNQLRGYFEFLQKQPAPERWLLFLVPKRWAHRGELNWNSNAPDDENRAVRMRVIYWEDVAETIEANDLAALNPFLNDFHELLMARFGPKVVTFTFKEIQMLFSSQIPTALKHLEQVIDGVRDRGAAHKVKPQASRSLYPTEYGLYFLDAKDRDVFWFGVWTDFWKSEGTPLCFGVSESDSAPVRQAFLAAYTGPTKHFGRYILGWFGPEVLEEEDAVDRIWIKLSPIADAILAARLTEVSNRAD